MPTINAGDLQSRGVEANVAAEFIALRERKKAKLTPLALEGIEREAARARMSLNAVLLKCIERGWQGFEAAWVGGEKRAGPARTERAEAERQRFLEITNEEPEDRGIIDMETP